MTRLIFLDCETTGLDPERHEIWEVAWIVRDVLPLGDNLSARTRDVERVEQLYLHSLKDADPYGLRVGRYWERRISRPNTANPWGLAEEIARTFDGATIVGAVPDFDVRFLTKWLRLHGQPWTGHYHLCDVENLAVGYLAGIARSLRDHGQDVSAEAVFGRIQPPWSSESLSWDLGVTIDEAVRHTALGDARWARDMYDAVMS